MFIVRLKNFQATPPLFGLSPFLYLSLRDFGCGKAMSFDDLFRKDRPNKMLLITPSRLVAAFTRTTSGPFKPDFGLSGLVRQLDRVFPSLFRVFVSSIPIRSLPALQARYGCG